MIKHSLDFYEELKNNLKKEDKQKIKEISTKNGVPKDVKDKVFTVFCINQLNSILDNIINHEGFEKYNLANQDYNDLDFIRFFLNANYEIEYCVKFFNELDYLYSNKLNNHDIAILTDLGVYELIKKYSSLDKFLEYVNEMSSVIGDKMIKLYEKEPIIFINMYTAMINNTYLNETSYAYLVYSNKCLIDIFYKLYNSEVKNVIPENKSNGYDNLYNLVRAVSPTDNTELNDFYKTAYDIYENHISEESASVNDSFYCYPLIDLPLFDDFKSRVGDIVYKLILVSSLLFHSPHLYSPNLFLRNGQLNESDFIFNSLATFLCYNTISVFTSGEIRDTLDLIEKENIELYNKLNLSVLNPLVNDMSILDEDDETAIQFLFDNQFAVIKDKLKVNSIYDVINEFINNIMSNPLYCSLSLNIQNVFTDLFIKIINPVEYEKMTDDEKFAFDHLFYSFAINLITFVIEHFCEVFVNLEYDFIDSPVLYKYVKVQLMMFY